MIDETRLNELLEEAIVDCYDEEEEFSGVLISVDENVAWPLPAQLAGTPVGGTGAGRVSQQPAPGDCSPHPARRQRVPGQASLT